MGLISRPDGATGFADLDDTVVVPSVANPLDTLFNILFAAVNSLDNANFSGNPKLAANKIDLTTGGYLPLDGSADMSANMNHAFDGVFRTMRASGNGRIREYRGSDGAIWGVSYNTYWTGSAWAGRDVTDICTVLKIESDGLHYYHAVSAGVGVVPTWVEVFHAGLTGLEVGAPPDGSVTTAKFESHTAGSYLIASADTERSNNTTTPTKYKEILCRRAGTYTVYFEGKGSNVDVGRAQIYKNGTGVGTTRFTPNGAYQGYSEDLTFAIGDLIQLYLWRFAAGDSFGQNFRLYVSNPDENAITLD